MVTGAVWPDTVDADVMAALDPGVPAELDRTPDVLVVGAGVLGLATAAACNQANLGRVVVLERDRLAARASGGAAAALSPTAHVWTEPPEFVALGERSVELYRQLDDSWGHPFAFRPLDWLIALPEGVPDSFTPPPGIDRLDASATAAAEPNLAAAGGALVVTGQAHLNPLLLAASLAAHAGQVATGVTVHEVETKGDRAVRVETSHGDIAPGAIVYATGVAPQQVLPAPQRWVKGHLVATAPAPFRLRFMVASGDGLVLQLADGRIVAGGTLDEGDDSPEPKPEVTYAIVDALHHLLPATHDLGTAHRWCCFRPAAEDGLPVVDRAPGMQNVWATAGHFRTGILMAAATGRALADWIATDDQPDEVKAFALDRFDARLGNVVFMAAQDVVQDVEAAPVRSVLREARLRLALALNIGVVIGQVVAGLAAHSIGLLADAGHNVTDVAALVTSLVAVRLARRPPTAGRSFGYHRSTILAAQANAAGVLVVTIFIAIEGVRRLFNPADVRGGIVLVAALAGAAVNGLAALLLHERHTHDLNMRSATLHMTSDAAASVGVAVAGAVIIATGWRWVDPAVSLAIGLVIAWQAWRLLRATTDVLLESTPVGLDPHRLAEAIVEVDGVDAVHDLHTWSLSSDVRALSAHLVLTGHPTLEEAQVVGERVKAAVRAPFSIAHATLELECEPCVEGEPECGMDVLTDPHAHT